MISIRKCVELSLATICYRY